MCLQYKFDTSAQGKIHILQICTDGASPIQLLVNADNRRP